MKTKILVFGLAALVFWQCRTEALPEVSVNTFYETELFREAQLAGLFEDSKTFVDLQRDQPWQELEGWYLQERQMEDFEIGAFVNAHFREAPMSQREFIADSTRSMDEHINYMWEVLQRPADQVNPLSSKIPLPKPYVVPGGRFREIYYWDSYFTMIGLVADGQEPLAKDMLANFGYLIDTLGFIPNGTRDYYLTRSQPPFFTLMVELLASRDSSLADTYFDQVEKEYAYWMEGASTLAEEGFTARVVHLKGDALANRFWDSGTTPRPESYAEDLHLASEKESEADKAALYANLRAAAASGWDFSSRWYASEGEFGSTRTTDLLPVDLNALKYGMERFLEAGYGKQGRESEAEQVGARASRRAALFQTHFWDAELGYFMDYDFTSGSRTGERTLAGVFPLYFGLATEAQAEAVKNRLEMEFLMPGGLVTTLKPSGQQWDAPNGWAPLQWMAVGGLQRYGHSPLAREIARRWVYLNEKVYRDTGKMMEKYNVQDTTLLSGGGEYPTQDGFGWSNGVALGFKALLQEGQQD